MSKYRTAFVIWLAIVTAICGTMVVLHYTGAERTRWGDLSGTLRCHDSFLIVLSPEGRGFA